MANFCKRHYEALALVMQESCPELGENGKRSDESEEWDRWRTVRDTLADMLATDNHLFKRDRFQRACEPGRNVRART